MEGLIALMESNFSYPINLGNPEEHTILEFAHIVQKLAGAIILVYCMCSSIVIN